MPYIKPQDRPELDKLLKPLADYIASLPADRQDGAFNYTVTRMLKTVYSDTIYFVMNRSMGVLESIKSEWYRRQVAPYEDQKIKENGDV
jgi:hypothetical protein